MVLFEDYHGGESGTHLDGFTNKVFQPAFERVEQLFGVKPLIVPMPTWYEFQKYYPSPEMDWRALVPHCVHDHDLQYVSSSVRV